MKNKNALELGLVLLIFLVVNIASQVYQPQITYNNGQGFDGVFYNRMAYQFSNGMKASSEGPFVYRIGTPFLVGLLFKNHLLLGFKVVNIAANLLAVFLFTLWLRLFIKDWRIRVLLVTLFITQWHGPVRFTYYDPSYTDPWLFVFLLLGLIVMQRIKAKPGLPAVVGMALITFVGVLFREIVILLPVALAWITYPLSGVNESTFPRDREQLMRLVKKPYYPFILPFLFGVAGFIVTHRLASQYNDYSFLKTALDWAYNKPILTYIHAYFITFGPLLILPVFDWRRSAKFLWEHQDLLVFMLGLFVIGWIGGSDTERFLYWAMPVVYVLIGLFIQDNHARLGSPWLIGLLVISTVCSQRLFWIVPDYPNNFHTPTPILSILSNQLQYLDLWSWFAERSIQAISLVEYLLLSCVLLLWIKLRMEHRKEMHLTPLKQTRSGPRRENPN